MNGTQHCDLPPSRAEQLEPPHVPQLALQHTEFKASTSSLRPCAQTCFSGSLLEELLLLNTQPVLAGCSHILCLATMYLGQHDFLPPGRLEQNGLLQSPQPVSTCVCTMNTHMRVWLI